jgi:hypothetical protein
MGSADYADDIDESFTIVSIIPAPAGMRAVLGKGKDAEEWPVVCLALVETDEVRAVLLDDQDGATSFADEFENFSGFIYAGETLEDHVKGKAAVLAEEKAREAKAESKAKAKAAKAKSRAKTEEAIKQFKDGTAVFNKLTKAKAKR